MGDFLGGYNMKTRSLASLTPADLSASPVWEFSSFSNDDTLVRPLPVGTVQHLSGRLVACEIALANGESRWGLLGNLDPTAPELNEHFATLSVYEKGSWFHLARYHDPDYLDRGPAQLAEVLGLPLQSVFPISFDLANALPRHLGTVEGTFLAQPRRRLSREELIALAVP